MYNKLRSETFGGVEDITYKLFAGAILCCILFISVIAGIIVNGAIFVVWTFAGLAIGLGLGWARKAE